MARDENRLAVTYSSRQQNEYFGWTDATTLKVPELADLFAERFPEIVAVARGDDWVYAGWYVQMLGFAERGHFPIAYFDWEPDVDARFLPLTNIQSTLLMPLGGDARDSQER